MRTHIYADESGNFDFTNGPGASRYFILASVATTAHAAETAPLELRRQLAWAGEPLPAGFHATNDKQRVRDRVFAIIARHNFRVDASILEKRKANPGRRTPSRLYGLAWYYHLSGVLSALAKPDEIHIVAANTNAADLRSEFHDTVKALASTDTPAAALRSTMWPAATNPMLQIAAYCAWAIQRKWELSDTRSYRLIQNRIASELDAFRGRQPTCHQS